MKTIARYAFAVLTALLFGLNVLAQSEFGQVDLTIGWGGYPWLESETYGDGMRPYNGPGPVRSSAELSNVYGISTGNMITTGTVAATADLQIRKWFSIPFTLAGNLVCQNVTELTNNTQHLVTQGTAKLLVGAKFKFFNRPKFNFYSSLNIGAKMMCYKNLNEVPMDDGYVSRSYRTQAFFSPCIQFVPLGLRFGGKVYGVLEVGAGTLYLGGMVGVGVRL